MARQEGTLEMAVEEVEEHPGHELIPDMAEEELGAAMESIRSRGILEPIEILSEEDAEARGEEENAGKLVDGRQRLEAAKKCGLDTIPAIHAGIPEDMPTAEYIWEKAVQRRHLSTSQRAVLGVYYKQKLEEEDGGQGTRSDLMQTFEREEGETSRDRAGRRVGVSGRSITTAEKVVEKAPDLAEKVRTGQMSLNRAIRQLNQREGKTKERTPFDNFRTQVRRLGSTGENLDLSHVPDDLKDDVQQILEDIGELEKQLEKLEQETEEE